jgi:hypothetical protein
LTAAVAEVAALVVGVVVGRQFGRVELEAGVVGGCLVIAHVVEHEELGFGAEIDGVADAGRLQIGFGLLGDAARVAVVGLAGDGSRMSQMMTSVDCAKNGSM